MTRSLASLFAVAVLLGPCGAQALGSSFTYQGRLVVSGAPATGLYDLELMLYDALTAGAQVGTTLVLDDVSVDAGLFTVQLDFGVAAFDGNDRWLAIGVRPGASAPTDPFTPLAPRQQLTPTPHALFAARAGSGGATFTLNGNLNLESTTSATVGVITKGGSRFLHDYGTDNTFLGKLAGNVTLTGSSSVGVGTGALGGLVGGSSNVAIGSSSLAALTGGGNNVAIGANAGMSLVNGTNNVYLGSFVGAPSDESDTIRIGGIQRVAYLGDSLRFLNDSSTDNMFIGEMAGRPGPGAGSTNLGIGQSALAAVTGFANVAIGHSSLTGLTGGGNNVAIGINSGMSLANGTNNVYLGSFAGGPSDESDTIRIGSIHRVAYLGDSLRFLNDSSSDNTFIGELAGRPGPGAGSTNLGIGQAALAAVTGSGNVALGHSSLTGLTGGGNNVAIGINSGMGLVNGTNNVYLGSFAGGPSDESDTIRIGSIHRVAYLGDSLRFLNDSLTDNMFIGELAGRPGPGAGSTNLGIGQSALAAVTGSGNVAIGHSSLTGLTGGGNNVAIGINSGMSLANGTNNVYLGSFAGGPSDESDTIRIGSIHRVAYLGDSLRFLNDSSSDNTFIGELAGRPGPGAGSTNLGIGQSALAAVTGSGNVALGHSSLTGLTGGGNNVAIGINSGMSLVNGTNNVYLGSFAGGPFDESDTIRVGSVQTKAFMAGVHGANVATGVAVYVKSDGQLGTVLSSRRYKQEIADMGAESDVLQRLRPVSFYYRPEHDSARRRQYGLIAEEVAEIAPQLVVKDEAGQPQTVAYQLVNAMLLNEVQKQQRLIGEQRDEISRLRADVDLLKVLVVEAAQRGR